MNRESHRLETKMKLRKAGDSGVHGPTLSAPWPKDSPLARELQKSELDADALDVIIAKAQAALVSHPAPRVTPTARLT